MSHNDHLGFDFEIDVVIPDPTRNNQPVRDKDWLNKLYVWWKPAQNLELRLGRVFKAGLMATFPPFLQPTVNYQPGIPFDAYAYAAQGLWAYAPGSDVRADIGFQQAPFYTDEALKKPNVSARWRHVFSEYVMGTISSQISTDFFRYWGEVKIFLSEVSAFRTALYGAREELGDDNRAFYVWMLVEKGTFRPHLRYEQNRLFEMDEVVENVVVGFNLATAKDNIRFTADLQLPLEEGERDTTLLLRLQVRF